MNDNDEGEQEFFKVCHQFISGECFQAGELLTDYEA